MAGTLITVSDAFRASLVAPENTGTNAHKVVEIGLCTASFDASNKKLEALPGELKRIDTFGGQNIDADTIHVTLLDNTADQYTLWGFGFYLEDGTLAAYYSQKAADGPIMEKSPAAQLLLSVDVQFATIDAAALSFPSASFLNPPASESVQGVIRIAMQAEVDAGTDDTRAVTPKKAAARYAPLRAPRFSGPVTITDTARVLIGSTADDGANALQVNGTGSFYGAVYKAALDTASGVILGANTGGDVLFRASGAGVDQKIWDITSTSTEFALRTIDDECTSAKPWIRALRGSGNSVSTVWLAQGRVIVGNVTDDGSNLLQVAGPAKFASKVEAGGAVTASCQVFVTGASGTYRGVYLRNGTSNRWSIGANATAEAGNAGADFSIERYDDSGAWIDTPITVSRATGVASFKETPTAPTPVAGDASSQLSTTQFVATAILNDRIGQIVYEPRSSVRAGYLKLNGALVNRADYPTLWAYAQASGALVTEAAWTAGSWGCFSSGDGTTTFRIPELRGEHLRCWDDGRGADSGRGIGTWQDSQNRSHAHGASSGAVGDHTHSAWTDTQGWHGHGNTTGGVGDHQHVVPWGENSAGAGYPWGSYGSNNLQGSHATDSDNTWFLSSPAGSHAHEIYTDGAHGHNVGIGVAAGHAHTITVNADGGTETRVRSVALLAMIRAY